jgi:glutamine synthetase
VLGGRTVVGAPPAKGQELEDQYFGSIKERISSYMHDVEEELFKLGIPAKTRHNEVAPSQYEIAPVYEEANLAVDQTSWSWDTLKICRQEAPSGRLLHENLSPRSTVRASMSNWSLSMITAIIFSIRGSTPQDNILFLVFLIATVRAVLQACGYSACSGGFIWQ